MVDEVLRSEIARRLGTLSSLTDLVPAAGLRQPSRVEAEMKEGISEGYDPYFCGNAALYISARCQRCGECCRDTNAIAISIEDCRRIARHLGLSQKKFMMIHTRPHVLDGRAVGTARMVHKAEGDRCPFYSPDLPGCSIHLVKPQVCSAAFYLSKMNLMLCKENRKFGTFPQCPSDRRLRARIEEFKIRLKSDPVALASLRTTFESSLPEVLLFHLLLRLKGMEIYFGRDISERMARSLGLKSRPMDEELEPAAFLYAVMLLETEEGDSTKECSAEDDQEKKS